VAGPALQFDQYASLFLYSTVIRRCAGQAAIVMRNSELLAAHSTVTEHCEIL
jgi:hypothetical protein